MCMISYLARKVGLRLRKCEETHAIRVDSPTAARERAKRLFESGRYSGVDAVTVTGDPELGEYDEPAFHLRLGKVPDSKGDEP